MAWCYFTKVWRRQVWIDATNWVYDRVSEIVHSYARKIWWKLWRESVDVDIGNEGKELMIRFLEEAKQRVQLLEEKSNGVLDKFQLCWGAQRIPALRRGDPPKVFEFVEGYQRKRLFGVGSAVNVCVNMLQKAVDNLRGSISHFK